MPRLSMDVQYARRWYGNFRTMDDLNIGRVGLRPVHDQRPERLAAAERRRLHADGVRSEARRRCAPAAETSSRSSKNYGDQTEVFNGVNISINARLQNGLTVQAGVGTGRVVTDDCDVVAALPEMLHANAFTGNPANP